MNSLTELTDQSVGLLIVSHLLLTSFMAGLIWFVQLVHYPLLVCVGDSEFPRYENEHMRRTTWIVAPVMLAEAAVAIALLVSVESGQFILAVTNVIILGVIWLSTMLMQAPLHQWLSKGKQVRLIHQLVRTNWIRTWAWTARVLIAAALLGQVTRAGVPSG